MEQKQHTGGDEYEKQLALRMVGTVHGRKRLVARPHPWRAQQSDGAGARASRMSPPASRSLGLEGSQETWHGPPDWGPQ